MSFTSDQKYSRKTDTKATRKKNLYVVTGFGKLEAIGSFVEEIGCVFKFGTE